MECAAYGGVTANSVTEDVSALCEVWRTFAPMFMEALCLKVHGKTHKVVYCLFLLCNGSVLPMEE